MAVAVCLCICMYSSILRLHQCALSMGTWQVQWHAFVGLQVMISMGVWGRQARMKSEYGVDTTLDPLPYSLARHALHEVALSMTYIQSHQRRDTS